MLAAQRKIRAAQQGRQQQVMQAQALRAASAEPVMQAAAAVAVGGAWKQQERGKRQKLTPAPGPGQQQQQQQQQRQVAPTTAQRLAPLMRLPGGLPAAPPSAAEAAAGAGSPPMPQLEHLASGWRPASGPPVGRQWEPLYAAHTTPGAADGRHSYQQAGQQQQPACWGATSRGMAPVPSYSSVLAGVGLTAERLAALPTRPAPPGPASRNPFGRR
jgi:hypothetical protein